MSRELEPAYAAFGRRVAQLRSRAGLTQGELGERLAPPVTRASIANLEQGKQRVYLHTVLQIALVLHTPVTDLLDGIGIELGVEDRVAHELQAKIPGADARVLRAIAAKTTKGVS